MVWIGMRDRVARVWRRVRCGVVGKRWGGWVVVKSCKGLVVVASKRVKPIRKARLTRDACPTSGRRTVREQAVCAQRSVHAVAPWPFLPTQSWWCRPYCARDADAEDARQMRLSSSAWQ